MAIDNKDFYFEFSSGIYLVVRDNNRGFVSPTKTLRLEPCKGRLMDLDTAVHESLHAEFPLSEFPAMTEDQVAKSAERISKFLWKLGYRIPK